MDQRNPWVLVCATGLASALRPELLGHWQSQWHTEIGFRQSIDPCKIMYHLRPPRGAGR